MKSFANIAFTALLAVGALAAPNGSPGPNPTANQYKVNSLPQVNFPVPQSWAGSLPIGQGYGNGSLFFWLWNAETTRPTAKDNLIIWFNGGPGCSSLTGLFKINGPVSFPNRTTTPKANPYSWTQGANILYIDQPAGTGFNTGPTTDISNPAVNEAAVVQWLDAWFKIFPEMKTKKIYLMGESAAGVFLPYIAQLIQEKQATLKFNVSSISLGNAQWGNNAVLQNVVATKFIREHQSSIGAKVPADVLAVLNQAEKDCGFADLLSQVKGPAIGTLRVPGNPGNNNFKRSSPANSGYNAALAADFNYEHCDFNTGGTQTAAQVAFLINNTGPSCFGTCGIFDAADNYFSDRPAFNVYNVNEKDYSTTYYDDAWVAYLRRADVQAAIHAPHGADFNACSDTIQQTLNSVASRQAPPAYDVIPGLLNQGVAVNIASGTLDYLLPHDANLVIIQNMTWKGQMGFTYLPLTDLRNKPFDVVARGQRERGLSYYEFDAGHRIGQDYPAAALEWVLQTVLFIQYPYFPPGFTFHGIGRRSGGLEPDAGGVGGGD